MAVSKYKSVDEFKFGGVEYGRGDTLILTPKDAKKLVEEGKIAHQRDLDPAIEKDAADIALFTDNPKGIAREAAPVKEPKAAPKRSAPAAVAKKPVPAKKAVPKKKVAKK